jgi:hypothetical protein
MTAKKGFTRPINTAKLTLFRSPSLSVFHVSWVRWHTMMLLLYDAP